MPKFFETVLPLENSHPYPVYQNQAIKSRPYAIVYAKPGAKRGAKPGAKRGAKPGAKPGAKRGAKPGASLCSIWDA